MSQNKKYKFIGLCLTRIQEFLESDFFLAAAKRAVEYGYKLLVFNAFDDFYYDNMQYAVGERYVYDLIPYDMLDGLIVMSETIKNEDILNRIITEAGEHDLFIVSVDKRIDGCYNIEFNYRGAFEAIVRHMIQKHNCRTINIVAGHKNNPFSDERIFCAKRVMAEYGIELDPRRILYGNFWANPTYKAFDEFMLSGLDMPDVFICCNDSMAMAVCTKLKEYGYAIPDDVMVTGFDGIIEEQYHIPRLTTAKQDVTLAGQRAVDAIVNHNKGKTQDNFCIIDHKVIWSHSCGCKKIDYREATGQLTPLFQRNVEDISFDTYMFEFNSSAAITNNIDDFSEMILKHSFKFGYHYYVLCLDPSFMNSTANTDSNDDGSMLILCENYAGEHHKPCRAKGPRYLEEAFDNINIFVYWSVHFQEKKMGYGITGISTGCDGLTANDDFRNILKYTRNVNQVLETSNNQYALKTAVARLQDLYIRDHVTGLYNRRGFYTELNKYIDRALEDKEKEYSLIILSVDMDGLKSINDTYGHAEGDVAINATAEGLKCIWTENVICSRFGGDEFTVACLCLSEPQKLAEELVSKIKSRISEFNQTSGKPYKVSASYGFMHDRITEGFIVDTLIKAADDLMYKEKLSHKESRARCCARLESSKQS